MSNSDWREPFRKGDILYDRPDGLVIHGDIADILPQFPEGSIDAIITDPPYFDEFLYTYKLLAEHGSRVMKDRASLLTCCGKHAVPTIIDAFKPYLTYLWSCGYYFPGNFNSLMRGFAIRVKWRLLHWYVKGAHSRKHWIEGRATQDMVILKYEAASVRKQLHKWQQSTMWSDYYVCELCGPGSIILDPFSGSGSTLLSAQNWDRKFIGIDIDRKSAVISANRVTSIFTEQEMQAKRIRSAMDSEEYFGEHV